MNMLDIVIGIALLLGLAGGLRKGLFVELASLVGLIAGIFGAIHFSNFAAVLLNRYFTWNQQVINLAAFALTFIGIVILIGLAGKLLTKIANFAALGLVNRIAGAAFGLLKMAFLISVALMFLNAWGRLIPLLSEDNKDESVLYTPVAALAPAFLPTLIKEAKELNPLKEE